MLKDRPDVTKYVETLLKDYSKEPQNTRFDGIITPPSSTRNIVGYMGTRTIRCQNLTIRFSERKELINL